MRIRTHADKNIPPKKKTRKPSSICIKAPKENTLLSPAGKFLKKFRIRKFSLNDTYNNEFNMTITETNPKKYSDGFIKKRSKSISPDGPKINNNIYNDLNLSKKPSDPYNKNIDIVRLNNENYILMPCRSVSLKTVSLGASN